MEEGAPTARRTSPSSYEILGQRVTLPCYVRKARALNVVYLVPSSEAATFVG